MKPVLDTSFLIKLKKNNEKVVKALKKYKKAEDVVVSILTKLTIVKVRKVVRSAKLFLA
jgi:predicted nucleic acid-binding protein